MCRSQYVQVGSNHIESDQTVSGLNGCIQTIVGVGVGVGGGVGGGVVVD